MNWTRKQRKAITRYAKHPGGCVGVRCDDCPLCGKAGCLVISNFDSIENQSLTIDATCDHVSDACKQILGKELSTIIEGA